MLPVTTDNIKKREVHEMIMEGTSIHIKSISSPFSAIKDFNFSRDFVFNNATIVDFDNALKRNPHRFSTNL